jgi:hypothetical protein
MVQAGTGLAHAVEADSLIEACHGFATLEKAKVGNALLNRILAQGAEHPPSNATALRARVNGDCSDTNDADRLRANQRLSATELEVRDEFTGVCAAQKTTFRDRPSVGEFGEEVGELGKSGDEQISDFCLNAQRQIVFGQCEPVYLRRRSRRQGRCFTTYWQLNSAQGATLDPDRFGAF